MTAARVRVPNSRNVRSLALQRSVARSGTIHGSLPQTRAGRGPNSPHRSAHERGRERERKRSRCSNLSSDLRAQWFVPVFKVQRTQQHGDHPARNRGPMMRGSRFARGCTSLTDRRAQLGPWRSELDASWESPADPPQTRATQGTRQVVWPALRARPRRSDLRSQSWRRNWD